jgi:hypothetical protein
MLVRLADPKSAVNMGDPSLNIKNKQFWGLAGWIDARWAAYQKVAGVSAEAQLAIEAANTELDQLDARGEGKVLVGHASHRSRLEPSTLSALSAYLQSAATPAVIRPEE